LQIPIHTAVRHALNVTFISCMNGPQFCCATVMSCTSFPPRTIRKIGEYTFVRECRQNIACARWRIRREAGKTTTSRQPFHPRSKMESGAARALGHRSLPSTPREATGRKGSNGPPSAWPLPLRLGFCSKITSGLLESRIPLRKHSRGFQSAHLWKHRSEHRGAVHSDVDVARDKSHKKWLESFIICVPPAAPLVQQKPDASTF